MVSTVLQDSRAKDTATTTALVTIAGLLLIVCHSLPVAVLSMISFHSPSAR